MVAGGGRHRCVPGQNHLQETYCYSINLMLAPSSANVLGGVSMYIASWKYLVTVILTGTCCFAQTDPGPRGGAPGAGAAIAGLTVGEIDFFNNQATPQFSQVEAVSDGLGPRFNLDSCGGCHIHPVLGGSSPSSNPQFIRASTMAPGNTVPSFLTA